MQFDSSGRTKTRVSRKIIVGALVSLLAGIGTAAPWYAAPSEALGLRPGRLFDSSIVNMVVNTSAQRYPISPLIYGVNADKNTDSNFASTLDEARPGLLRLGGNRWTAYNWENNASNAGSDYEYENDNYLSSSSVPGAAVLPTVSAASAAGIPILVTIPIAGHVSADTGPPGDVRNSGRNYLKTRFKVDEPIDPKRLTVKPDTKDRYVYQDQFVFWLKHKYPHEPVLFSLDNEPDLWSSTHAEIHPKPVTYAKLLAKDIAYAKAVKRVWPAASVTGPVSYGWYGYETLQGAPDSGKDGNFLSWYLAHVRAAGERAHRRLIDYLDLHWYPEATGDGIRITGTDTSRAVVQAREQAPRSLWDPTYVENSWITQSLGNHSIVLIPRLQRQINAADPGIKIAFTEWNYGGGQSISGGIATADVLGTFGRYGVGAACFWPLNADESYSYGAFAMFRNYDGHGASFGDTSVSAQTSAPDTTSVYASIDRKTPTHVVMVLINKRLTSATTDIQLQGGIKAKRAAVYTLTAGSHSPALAGTVTTSTPDTFRYTMPAQSVSVIVPTPVKRAG